MAADPPEDHPDHPDAPDTVPVIVDLPAPEEGATGASEHHCVGDILEYPHLVFTDVETTVLFYCFGAIRQVRYELWLQRHVWWFHWDTLDSHDTGWTTRTDLLKTLHGTCTPGVHTYRIKVKISVIDVFGASNILTGQASRVLDC